MRRLGGKTPRKKPMTMEGKFLKIVISGDYLYVDTNFHNEFVNAINQHYSGAYLELIRTSMIEGLLRK